MLKTKEQKGITLISLVITIILLLILATVAISLAVDSDGLFSKAGEAANKWNTSVAQEQSTIQNLINRLNQKTLGEVYSEEMQGQSVTYEANGQKEWIILGEDSEKAGNILITIKEPIANGFNLYGSAEKWLSYEADLHDACAVYGGSISGVEVEARSITMEDINLVTGFEEPEFTTYTFGNIQDYANNKVNYLYPKVGSTWTDGDGTEWISWKLPTEENEATFEENYYLYNDTTCRWNGDNIDVSEMIESEKADLIWGANNELRYLVASRSLYIWDGGVEFNMAGVYNGYASRYNDVMCSSLSGSCDDTGSLGSFGLRPVVSVPSYVPVEEVNGIYDFVQINQETD